MLLVCLRFLFGEYLRLHKFFLLCPVHSPAQNHVGKLRPVRQLIDMYVPVEVIDEVIKKHGGFERKEGKR